MIRTSTLSAVAGCALTACGFYHGPSQAQLDADLKKRAGFDMSCAPEQVAVSPLASPNEVGLVPTQGVIGCGKKGTYVLTAERGYVLNGPVSNAAP